MKPKTILNGRLALAVLAITTTFALVSWDFRQSGGRYGADPNDTVPKKSREKKIRDLDDVLDELNSHDFKIEMEKLQIELGNIMKDFDAGKLKLEIDKAMKGVDFDKIKLDFDLAMKEVDFDKIKLDIDKAMKEVDLDKIKLDFDLAMKEVDFNKIKLDIDKAMKEVDLDKIKLDIDLALKEVDFNKINLDIEKSMKEVEEELKKIKPGLEKELYKVKEELDKVKADMEEYKELVDGLEKEGLLNKKEPYTIRHKDGELTVNGKKVPAATYNKYRKTLEKHKTFTIEKTEDDFNIDID